MQALYHRPTVKMLSTVCEYIKENPRHIKRIIKCAVTLALVVGLTIHHPLVEIWGVNPYLVGTTVSVYPLSLDEYPSHPPGMLLLGHLPIPK